MNLFYDLFWLMTAILPTLTSANEGQEGKEEEDPQEYLVKVLLNEKEAVLPLATDRYPYYHWKDLRNYYIKKLEALHTGLDKDMR